MIENRFFPEIYGNLGFSCMRLPMKDGRSGNAGRELLKNVARTFEDYRRDQS